MDNEIDIEEHDILDNSLVENVYPDFSQVKIEVHESEVAENIEENLEGQEYDAGYLHYPEDAENGIPGDHMEAPQDYPEQLLEEDTVSEEPEDYLQSSEYRDVTIKEEIDQFEGTDFTDFNEVPPEPYDDDLPPEDIYHFKNKIILGTKPCGSDAGLQDNIYVDGDQSDANDVYKNVIRKENLSTTVLLEDWGVHLNQSLSYCKECRILFSTPNALDAHNMTAHSFLVAVSKNVALKSTARPAFARKSTGTLVVKRNKNIARKSTASNELLKPTFCNHCNIVFSDHTALIKHLYELVPLKRFQCSTCDVVFNTQKDLIEHNALHIKLEKTKIKKEKVTAEPTNVRKKLLYEEDVKNKPPRSPKSEVKLVPLSALFHCTKCNAHFLTAFAGMQHIIHCVPPARRKMVPCRVCKRMFRETDVKGHKNQHELCSKFKVYKVTSNVFERTFCKCPKCGVHFNDLTLKPHLKNCGKLPTAFCQKCNILIPKASLYVHSKKHEKQSLKLKDFIIVQYYIQEKSLKRKLKPISTPAKKMKFDSPKSKSNPNKTTNMLISHKIKLEPMQEKEAEKKIKIVNRLKFETKGNKIRMYFCKNCNGCCIKDSNRTVHLSKRCKASRSCERVICQECGLLFNNKTIVSHKALHKRRKLTIHDIVFYHIGTLKRIIPSIPDYPKCKECNITFFSKTLLNKHICGEDYETCNACGEKFHNSAFNIHKEFHKFINTNPRCNTEAKIMPELIKKYQSLNMMWNVVYCCQKCDIVTDLYDKAVEHSQSHLYNETTPKTIKCYICNLKFDETCWSKHSDLHSRMTLNSKDFKILNYDPRELLTEEWFKVFENLPEEQIRQITGRSLYSYERSVKMKLLKDGRSEFTLYCCSRCKICYHNNDISNHLKTACNAPANICKICDIPFYDISSLRYHELLHLKGIKKEEFRVVSFAKGKAEKVEVKKSDTEYVIYKCTSCKSCMTRKATIYKHKCLSESRTSKCKKCNQIFYKSFMAKHNRAHKQHPDFNLKNIKIELFESLNKDNYEIDPLKTKYKKKMVTKPATMPDTSKTAKVNTSMAVADTSKTSKLNFKPGTEDTSKSATPDTTKAKAETKTAKVFKCECGLHYTSLKTIEKHKENCPPDSDISKENCSKCGLLFPTDVLVSHLCKHHSKNTKIIVETYQKPEPETSYDSVESTSETPTQEPRSTNKMKKHFPSHSKVKLYKCGDCNIYYMTQNTCYRHVYKSHQPVNPIQYIECKLCGLQFTIKSLSIHITKHHQREFSLDNVLVEEYHPSVGKEAPKIDIYIAAEKVQSRQVTSSMEESR